MIIREIIRSDIDKSINMIFDHRDGGKVETRAIQRSDDTLIVYLSSDIGCNALCKQCFLTQTGQIQSRPLSLEDFYLQAYSILNLLEDDCRLDGVTTIHYNFMAQGDILLNQSAMIYFELLYTGLKKIANQFISKANVLYKLSTIFPKASFLFNRSEEDQKIWLHDRILSLDDRIEFYYSLYTLKEDVRKRWLPNAADPEHIGKLFSGKIHGLRIHHALIKDVNDSEEDIALIHDWLERHTLYVGFNIVRYNSFNDKTGMEPSETTIKAYVNQMNLSHRVNRIQIIPRADPKTYVSCGMFLDK